MNREPSIILTGGDDPVLIIKNGVDPMVSVYPDGRVEYHMEVEPDEVAKKFWEAMAFCSPIRQHRDELEKIRRQAERVGEDVRDRVAKAIADVIGHGMREKCYQHANAALEAALSAQPAERQGGRTRLPYTNPMDLFRAFAAGSKFVLHYHGKEYPVARMDPREKVVYVQPPGLPVKVLPDGRSAEGPGNGIWLEQVHPAAPVGVPDGMVLDADARIGNMVFRKGVRWSTVIGAAQRQSKYHEAQPAERQGEAVPRLMAKDDASFIKPEFRGAYATGWNDARTWVLTHPAAPVGVPDESIEENGKWFVLMDGERYEVSQIEAEGWDYCVSYMQKLNAAAPPAPQGKAAAWCPKCAANQPHHTDPNSSGCLHLCDVCNSVVEY
jgi:hypothetical protein